MRASWLVAPLVALAVSACGLGQPDPAPTKEKEASPWENAGVHAGEGPAFPAELDGWRLAQSWNQSVRVFNDKWSTASSKDWSDFPATMNGCDGSQFLVRWRALHEDTIVVSAWANGELSGSDAAPSNAGWMVLDGCETPRWQLLSPYSGDFLADLTVDYQEWTPAP